MTTTIIIRKILGGFAVLRHKTSGLQKGETVLGTFCGGNLGRVLTINCAQTASLFCMADEVVFEDDEAGTIRGEQAVIDMLASFEVAA